MALRVLIVDDAPVIRQIIRQMLMGYDVLIVGEAADGDEGVVMTLQSKPDLVLMDIQMPKKNGIEAAREILAQAPSTAIVALSTADHEPLLHKALEVGCREYVTKPFKADDLLRALSVASGTLLTKLPRGA